MSLDQADFFAAMAEIKTSVSNMAVRYKRLAEQASTAADNGDQGSMQQAASDLHALAVEMNVLGADQSTVSDPKALPNNTAVDAQPTLAPNPTSSPTPTPVSALAAAPLDASDTSSIAYQRDGVAPDASATHLPMAGTENTPDQPEVSPAHPVVKDPALDAEFG